MKRYCKNCHRITESITELNSCPQCGASFEPIGEPEKQTAEPSPPPPPPPVQPQPQAQQSDGAEEKYTPWEDRDKLGFVGSLFETWKESLFNPTKFFRRLPVKGGLGNPILYGLILGFIGIVFHSMWEQFFGQLFDPSHWAPYLGRDFDYDFYEFTRHIESISFLFTIIIMPVFLLASFFIISGIVHLILLIFGWNKEDYEATFRITTYTEGTSFFMIIPIIGWMIASIWQLVLMIIGIKEIHRTTTGQAILVMLLPLILCCACCCGFASMIMGMAGLSN
ncbi:MAG: hypothetical protein GY839_04710 [candidate division Zixibacteria bacterium]|nr:hypothetical protein [candidate division Zixibacteria bacterium]